jgi:LMBR1 domain-containing protein 1
MDIFALIISIILGVLLVFVNFYILALYCHPEDGGFGSSLICKIVVVKIEMN